MTFIKSGLAWSREEDMKLMSLARSLPQQWKTISNLMRPRDVAACKGRHIELVGEMVENDSVFRSS